MTRTRDSGTVAPRSPSIVRASLADYPSINPFALDLVRNDPRSTRYCRRTSLASLKPSGVDRNHRALIDELASSNRTWGNDVSVALEQWNRGETVTLIAGQQVGFGGGPLYTLAKIASLLRLKHDLESRGINSTLFFWMATEDHDYTEVARITLPSASSQPVTISDDSHSLNRKGVGELEIPDSLRERLLEALNLEGPRWLPRGVTLGESFARLIAEVVEGESLVLVDSLLPSLRRAGAPLILSLTERLEEANEAVAERSRRLVADGYTAQVSPRQNGQYPLLFHRGETGEREPLEPGPSGEAQRSYRIGSRMLEGDGLRQLIETHPERISTGALGRPLLQDYVFRPDIFLGGPAEVAYYAQVTPLHELLSVPQPHVALRGHALVVEHRHMRAIDRYEIEPEEIFDSASEILARRDSGAIGELEAMAQGARQRIDEEIAPIRQLVTGIDKTLDRSMEKSLRKINYQLGKLVERGQRALLRRDQERYKAVRELTEAIRPGGVTQDRVMAWLPLWINHGHSLLVQMTAAIEPDSDRVIIAAL